jgi:hypothetical protein
MLKSKQICAESKEIEEKGTKKDSWKFHRVK